MGFKGDDVHEGRLIAGREDCQEKKSTHFFDDCEVLRYTRLVPWRLPYTGESGRRQTKQ